MESIRTSATCLALLLGLLVAVAARAEIGQVKFVAGEVQVQRGETRLVAAPGLGLQQADVVITGEDGRIGMTFKDNSRFSAGPNSTLELATFRFDTTTHQGRFISRLRRGTLAVSSGQLAKQGEDQMEVHTPTSILGVRGTYFLVEVAP
ncbi:MAG: FecR domain-containing protein [Gammaproteobacteria bacterium]|nr:FecR domain-containing protein [Gammaproteobacteria bacterium]